jgi:hypothetical protein
MRINGKILIGNVGFVIVAAAGALRGARAIRSKYSTAQRRQRLPSFRCRPWQS